MKSWFPFTDYDFYAYLASGALLIATIDSAFNGGAVLARPEWSFVAGIVFVAAAYVVGHLVAAMSSPILEHWLARDLLTPPGVILLKLRDRNWIERQIGSVIGRNYEPFPEAMLAKITAAAQAEFRQHAPDFEDIFQSAHRQAYAVEHTRNRVEQFRNLYGFCRNIAFVSYIASASFTTRAGLDGDAAAAGLAAVALIAAIGMTLRFLKFYASFAAEVLRTLTK